MVHKQHMPTSRVQLCTEPSEKLFRNFLPVFEMGADGEPPADAAEVQLTRKPVPKKVPTGDPDKPFRYEAAPTPQDGNCGIGISFFIGEDGWPVVKEIGEQGSAHDSGQIGVGQVIYAVDGKSTYKHTVPQVVGMIKGPVDSTVTLLINKRENRTPAPQPEAPVAAAPPPAAPAPRQPREEEIQRAPVREEIPEPPPREREEEQRLRDQRRVEADMAAAAEARRKKDQQMKEQQEIEERVRQQQIQKQQEHHQPSQLFNKEPPMNSVPSAQGDMPTGNEDGFCVKKWPDGKLYRGEMKSGRRHGQGSITYPDGASYEGDWRDDGRHGIGEYRYTDGTWYKGQWVNGNREGEGLCTYSDGNMYQGEWARNLPHGSGKCRFADGSVYKGEFQNGRMHGVGTLFRHDGAVEFHGHWKDGEKLRPMAEDPAADASLAAMPPADASFQIADTTAAAPPELVPPAEDDPNAPPIKLFVTFQGASHLPKMSGPEAVPSPYVVASVATQTHITKTLPPNFEPRSRRRRAHRRLSEEGMRRDVEAEAEAEAEAEGEGEGEGEAAEEDCE